MTARWQNEKEAIEAIKAAKQRLEEARQRGRAGRARRPTSSGRRSFATARSRSWKRRSPNRKARLAELHSSGPARCSAEEVTEEDIAEVVAKWTGIPVSRLLEGEVEKLIQMEERLHERVIGQEEAIAAVSNALRRSRAGLSDPNRPIG